MPYYFATFLYYMFCSIPPQFQLHFLQFPCETQKTIDLDLTRNAYASGKVNMGFDVKFNKTNICKKNRKKLLQRNREILSSLFYSSLYISSVKLTISIIWIQSGISFSCNKLFYTLRTCPSKYCIRFMLCHHLSFL